MSTGSAERGSAARFVVEGAWSGYRSSQSRVVHRTVHTAAEKKLRAWAENTHALHYTDGTSLYLTVRDCLPRERVKEIRGYTSLILDCAMYSVTSVGDLSEAKAKAKAARIAAATGAAA